MSSFFKTLFAWFSPQVGPPLRTASDLSTVPSMPKPPIPTINLLEVFIAEMKAMEGWAPGTTSYTNCNPGNLRCTGDKSTWNVLASSARNNFCIFKDETTGMQALRNVTVSCAKGLSPHYNIEAQKLGLFNSGELNLYQYFLIRDPASDGNDPKALAERFGKVLKKDPALFRMKQLLS